MVHPFELRLLQDAGRRAYALRDAALDRAFERGIGWLRSLLRPTPMEATPCRS